MIHELKIAPQYFRDVQTGKKGFEVRKFDRLFHIGDLLALNEYDGQCYTGNSILVYIDYMLSDPEYVKSGYVILGIKPCAVQRMDDNFNQCTMAYDYSVPFATVGVREE